MIHQYISYLAYTKGYSNNTLKSYTQALTQFVNYRKQCDSNARWSTTTAGDVQDYLAWMKQCEKSTATIHLHASAIKGLFRFIVHNGGTIDKAIYHVECPKMVKSDVATIAPADIEETIADTSLSIDTRLIIALIADSGLRISEVLSLRPLDFDKSSMSITIAGKAAKLDIVITPRGYKLCSIPTKEIPIGMLNYFQGTSAQSDIIFTWRCANIAMLQNYLRISLGIRLRLKCCAMVLT